MATFNSWQAVVVELRRLTSNATSEQLTLAARSGLNLPDGLPKLVAAARLKAALTAELLFAINPPTEGKLAFLATLNSERTLDACVRRDGNEADAWIAYYLFLRRLQSLEALRLEAGDIVETSIGRYDEVASIRGDGRVYFKGGRNSAWPDTIVLRCRKSDETEKALALKANAANQASSNLTTGAWSRVKEADLAQFRVTARLTHEDVEQLRAVIDTASDEKVIHQFLELHPQILTAILGGQTRFCLSHPSLGGKWVPDFIIGEVNSLGIRWRLVELETPVSAVTLSNDNTLEKHARKGVSQIEEWRNWILENLALARRPRRENGLGLFDIRPQSEGLVLIGRRAHLHSNADSVRHPSAENSKILIHTYDWLIDQLEGVMTFNGPPACNPYLLQPLEGRE